MLEHIILVLSLLVTTGSARPSDLEVAQTQLPKLTQPLFDANDRSRRLERVPYEVLGTCVTTSDGQGVPVYRCLGGNEQPPAAPNTEAFYLESTATSRVITLRPTSGLLPVTDERREYLRQPALRPQMNPFLVVDAYHSSDKEAYRSGFPAHPHSGMLEIRHFHRGGLHHEDGCGNIVVTPPGGAQMLLAGRGIAHEELPVGSLEEAWHLLQTTRAALGVDEVAAPPSPYDEEDGSPSLCSPRDPTPFKWDGFYGFQLWLQLPTKLQKARPQFRSVSALPTVHLVSVLHTTFIDRVQRVEEGLGARPSLIGGTSPTVWSEWSPEFSGNTCPWDVPPALPTGRPDASVRVLAGRFHNVTGPFSGVVADDEFMYLDIELRGRSVCEANRDDAHKFLTIDLPPKQNVLLYVFTTTDDDPSCPLTPMLRVGGTKEDAVVVKPRSLVVLSEGTHVVLNSVCMGACGREGTCGACPSVRVLLMTAPPVPGQAFVHQGFVGGSEASVRHAMKEFKEGRASKC